MKITINVECTPEEARTFLGLPDVSAVNTIITDALSDRVKDNIETLSDPVRFWERAMVSGGQSFEAMQAAFSQAVKAADKG